MAMSDDLYLAIFAMDAYNRGYRQGVTPIGNQLGTATLGVDSSILLDQNNQRLDLTVDFFAQTYSWNGQTVISYRGTDSTFGNSGTGLDGDALNGYGISLGSYNGMQVRLAAQFYQNLRGSGSTDGSTGTRGEHA